MADSTHSGRWTPDRPESTLPRRRAGSIGVIQNSLSGHSKKSGDPEKLARDYSPPRDAWSGRGGQVGAHDTDPLG